MLRIVMGKKERCPAKELRMAPSIDSLSIWTACIIAATNGHSMYMPHFAGFGGMLTILHTLIRRRREIKGHRHGTGTNGIKLSVSFRN